MKLRLGELTINFVISCYEKAKKIISSSASMHDCSFEIEEVNYSISPESSDELVNLVSDSVNELGELTDYRFS